MVETAFIIRVPEAESCVGDLRERFDASAGIGVIRWRSTMAAAPR